MTTNQYSRAGIASLLAAHCAGMLDLVALPIWMGALIAWFKLDPQQAGLLISLFLAGQVVSSVALAPRFESLPTRLFAVLGFAIAGASFLGVSQTSEYTWMATCHFLGGLGAGCALSVTHGTIGRSENPHRLFALAGFAIAIFGIFVLGGGSKLVAIEGGPALFLLFALLMFIAMAMAALSFPKTVVTERSAVTERLSPQVWFGMVGMGFMALAQATAFSFVERIGADRAYGASAIAGVLVAVGFVSLIPAPLAGWLQNRLRAEVVVVAGPLLHAAAVFIITHTSAYEVYAVLVPVLIGIIVFTHTFLFGLLARLDSTGRAVAATPAMVMIGAAVGPILGGTVVKMFGYSALGILVVCIGALSALMFMGARSRKLAHTPA